MRKSAAFLFIVLWVMAGCTASAAPAPAPTPPSADVGATPEPYWPTEGWRFAQPEQMGMDGKLLGKLAPDVKGRRLGIDGVLVARGGYVVLEEYFNGYLPSSPHAQYSVTKSVVATLVGVAVDEGKIQSIDRPVMEILGSAAIQNPSPEKDHMTIHDLLTMRSGLSWDDDEHIDSVYRSPNWVSFILSLPMAGEPGAAFKYCSGCSHLLSAVVADAAGQDTAEYAKETLFAPLGIREAPWERDSSGLSIGGWGLALKPRDMAKLGYLYLRGGEWDGKQVVSRDWVRAATTTQVALDGMSYGYQWWIADYDGAFAAHGAGGQTIFVDPRLDLVIVVTANLDNHGPVYELIETYIFPAVKN